jgi:hypothetical protein
MRTISLCAIAAAMVAIGLGNGLDQYACRPFGRSRR